MNEMSAIPVRDAMRVLPLDFASLARLEPALYELIHDLMSAKLFLDILNGIMVKGEPDVQLLMSVADFVR
jgi:hypothetical protein